MYISKPLTVFVKSFCIFANIYCIFVKLLLHNYKTHYYIFVNLFICYIVSLHFTAGVFVIFMTFSVLRQQFECGYFCISMNPNVKYVELDKERLKV